MIVEEKIHVEKILHLKNKTKKQNKKNNKKTQINKQTNCINNIIKNNKFLYQVFKNFIKSVIENEAETISA